MHGRRFSCERTEQKVEAKFTADSADTWALHLCASFVLEILRLSVFGQVLKCELKVKG